MEGVAFQDWSFVFSICFLASFFLFLFYVCLTGFLTVPDQPDYFIKINTSFFWKKKKNKNVGTDGAQTKCSHVKLSGRLHLTRGTSGSLHWSFLTEWNHWQAGCRLTLAVWVCCSEEFGGGGLRVGLYVPNAPVYFSQADLWITLNWVTLKRK